MPIMLFLIGCWVHLADIRIADQVQALRQVTVDVGELGDEKNRQLGLHQHIVADLRIHCALLQHEE